MKTNTGRCSAHKDIIKLLLAPLKKKSLNKGQCKSSAMEEKEFHLAQQLKNLKHLSLKNGLQFWITGTR